MPAPDAFPPSVSRIGLHLSSSKLPLFFYVLRAGILAPAETGLSIRDFLRQKLGVSPVYLDREIQTVLLDGKPVDDLNNAPIGAGSTLALSAAMPGMAGATMRSSGFYATFRQVISYHGEKGPKSEIETPVMVKCFNKVAEDLGPGLLEKGVTLRGETFQEFLDLRFEDFQKDLEAVSLDSRSVAPRCLRRKAWGGKTVLLRVTTHPKP